MWWLFGLVQLALLALVAFVVVRTMRRVPRGEERARLVATGEGHWYCVVHKPGVWRLETLARNPGSGELTLREGQLTFTRKGEPQPVWSHPANQLKVAVGGGLQRELRMITPQGEELLVAVSHDPLFSWRGPEDSRALVENSLVDDLVTMLRGWGAQPLWDVTFPQADA
ncbi:MULTISPECIES: hypothetical protein [unclassified Luteococcus]|uniref:hypothetical protein n=1 Tax=unclassified Luteococcus TaxID=2639923 RepID=UPI00313AB19F